MEKREKHPKQRHEPAADAPLQRVVDRHGGAGKHQAQLRRYADIANGGTLTQRKATVNGGLPANLKSGIESLSGIAMDDVRVHYNSPKPAQLQAHAFAQGSDIHLAAGQEKHLAHEAWHVVQQKQGRVKPTLQLKGVAINDDTGLEREADVMGEEAARKTNAPNEISSSGAKPSCNLPTTQMFATNHNPIQRVISYKMGKQYPDKEALVTALMATFPQVSKEFLLGRIAPYENASWSISAGQVFDRIVNDLSNDDEKPLVPSFATVSEDNDHIHGPKLPNRPNRKAKEDMGAAMSSFNTASATLGRLTLWHGDDEPVSFHDRQVDKNFHAEDGLIQQLQEYLEDHVIDPQKTKVNLTINNFFCSYHTTKKGKKSNNCLDRILALQKSFKFAEFHVYFKNTYGGHDQMTESIKQLRAVGINVTAISTNSSKPPYHNAELDPDSDHDDEDVDMDTGPSISGERAVDQAIVQSVVDYIQRKGYFLRRNLLVVSGSRWTCYIRCVLHNFGRIGDYNAVISAAQKQGLDLSSGVVIGSDLEEQLRGIIRNVTGQAFHVEATDAAHGGLARSRDNNGQRVYLLLTGAHFSLLM